MPGAIKWRFRPAPPPVDCPFSEGLKSVADIETINTGVKRDLRVQVKFSIDEQQAAFLNDYKAYRFKDKSALVRQAIVQFRKQLEMESLRESAELYAELL